VADKNPSLDDSMRRRIARQVGIGALKYGDLSNDRIKDYIFDWSRMLALDGNTAPYLQYAHARTASILRKPEAVGRGEQATITINDPAERALGLELLHFNGIVEEVADSLQPHRLSGYLYEVATLFMSFFERCPVLKAETDALRVSRLELCEATQRTLRQGLELLGIEAPERM
jgi:arginyl-tRNA synthetase